MQLFPVSQMSSICLDVESMQTGDRAPCKIPAELPHILPCKISLRLWTSDNRFQIPGYSNSVLIGTWACWTGAARLLVILQATIFELLPTRSSGISENIRECRACPV